MDEGYYAPSDYDSKQVRESVMAVISYRDEHQLSDEETWQRMLSELQYDYEESQIQLDSEDLSTSSFFSMGDSD